MSIKYPTLIMVYRTLVLGGGSVKGIAMIGALAWLESNNMLNHIEKYYATSIGSMIAVLMAAGLGAESIFQRIMSDSSGTFVDMYSNPDEIIKNLGIADITTFGDRIRVILIEMFGYTPTFRQLYTFTRRQVYIVGTNCTTGRQVVFSHLSHPEMSVVDAVEISCTLPFIFGKKYYDGCEWIDGGFVNDYPIDLADTDAMGEPADTEIIGICVDKFNGLGAPDRSKDDIFESARSTESPIGMESIRNMSRAVVGGMLEKLLAVITIPVQELHRMRMDRSSSRCTTITLTMTGAKHATFRLTDAMKQELYTEGYTAAEAVVTLKKKREWESEWDVE